MKQHAVVHDANPCDLCGAADAELVLRSPRIDGPLVRCRRCGLCYVGTREHDFTFSSADPERSDALIDRVHELGIVDHEVEDAEDRWRRLVHEERVALLRRHGTGPKVLDVGCGAGAFLEVAGQAGLEATGLEPDPNTSEQARARGLDVRTATLDDAGIEDGSFDTVVLWHVIEHMSSPSATVAAARRVLKPGGLLAVETPAIDTPFARVFGSRWRQLIPDHYFFFSRRTLPALLARAGLEPLEVSRVGKPMSVRFFADRVRRVSPALGAPVGSAVTALGLEERTLRVNLGDIISAVAREP